MNYETIYFFLYDTLSLDSIQSTLKEQNIKVYLIKIIDMLLGY